MMQNARGLPPRHRPALRDSGEFPILRNSGVHIFPNPGTRRPGFGNRKPELGSGRASSLDDHGIIEDPVLFTCRGFGEGGRNRDSSFLDNPHGFPLAVEESEEEDHSKHDNVSCHKDPTAVYPH